MGDPRLNRASLGSPERETPAGAHGRAKRDLHSLAVADIDGDLDVVPGDGPLSASDTRRVAVWENRAGATARPTGDLLVLDRFLRRLRATFA